MVALNAITCICFPLLPLAPWRKKLPSSCLVLSAFGHAASPSSIRCDDARTDEEKRPGSRRLIAMRKTFGKAGRKGQTTVEQRYEQTFLHNLCHRRLVMMS